MATVKAFKWMKILSEAEEICKKKKPSDNATPLEIQNFSEALQLRNMAYIELLRAKIPFLHIEDDDIVRINLDETNYDIEINTLRDLLSEEEFQSIIVQKGYDTSFSPDRDLYVEEQKDDELETLRRKILSYGANFDEQSYEQMTKEHLEKETAPASKFVDDYEEKYQSQSQILDYRVGKDGKMRAVNTVEYAFMGVSHGVGVTHTAMMYAMLLGQDQEKSVALVEINNSGNMKELGEWLSGQKIETNNYPLGNVDVYFGIDYLTFTAMYKDNYDYVVVDFGCYNRKREAIKEFIRIKNKFVVASGVDWKLPTLEDFYDDYAADVTHSITYLVPFLSEEYLAPVGKIVKPNNVVGIPFNINPFHPSDEVKNALGLTSQPSQVSKDKKHKFRLFGKKKEG